MYINAFMQPGALLYCTDFAPKMIEEFEIGFKNSELSNNEKVSFTVLKDHETILVEDFAPEQKCKKVFLAEANGS
jgi:hypothetical protein